MSLISSSLKFLPPIRRKSPAENCGGRNCTLFKMGMLSPINLITLPVVGCKTLF